MPTGAPTGSGGNLETYATDPAAFRQEATSLNTQYPGTNAGNTFLSIAQHNPNASIQNVTAAVLLFLDLGQGVSKAVGQATTGISDVANTTGQAVGTSPLTGINAVGDFFQRLSQSNTWVRVGEVAAGLLLLYVAVSAVTRNNEVVRTVKRVVK